MKFVLIFENSNLFNFSMPNFFFIIMIIIMFSYYFFNLHHEKINTNFNYFNVCTLGQNQVLRESDVFFDMIILLSLVFFFP